MNYWQTLILKKEEYKRDAQAIIFLLKESKSIEFVAMSS